MEKTKACPHCKQDFVPNRPDQIYCKPKHGEYARRKRKGKNPTRVVRIRRRLPKECPTPEKLRYKNNTVAQQVCDINKWVTQIPYACRCGWTHTRTDGKYK